MVDKETIDNNYCLEDVYVDGFFDFYLGDHSIDDIAQELKNQDSVLDNEHFLKLLKIPDNSISDLFEKYPELKRPYINESAIQKLEQNNSQKIVTSSSESYDDEGFEYCLQSKYYSKIRHPSFNPVIIDNFYRNSFFIDFDKDGNLKFDNIKDTKWFNEKIATYLFDPQKEHYLFDIPQWVPTKIIDGQELKLIDWRGYESFRGKEDTLTLSYSPESMTIPFVNMTHPFGDTHGVHLSFNLMNPPLTEFQMDYRIQKLATKANDYPEKFKWIQIGSDMAFVENGDPRDFKASSVKIFNENFEASITSYRYTVDTLLEMLMSIPKFSDVEAKTIKNPYEGRMIAYSSEHQGISLQDLQCKNESHVLVVRDNGKNACVTEKTAERMGWEIISQSMSIEQTTENSEDEHVNLASYAEYKKMFDNDFKLYPGIGWIDMSGRTSSSIIYNEDPANLGELILDLDAMFDEKPVIFPENSLMSVQTDKTEYNYNEVIRIKGQVADVVGDPCNKFLVSVHVRNNDNTKFYDYASAEVNSDCIYETTIDTSGSKWIHEGIYVLTASPGNGAITANTEIELISGFTPPQRSFNTQDTVLDLSSPTEFVDDGREYPRAMGHRGPPQLMYDIILDRYKDFDVDKKGVATFTSIPHEKYSINPGVGFYAEDWFPEYIPDGQKLLFTETSCHESGSCGLGITFVPTTFVLTPFTTNHNLNLAKGFSVGVHHSTLPVDELEDSAEHLREIFIESEGGYGEIREMTRDGKTLLGFAGGNSINPYQATVSFHPDKFTSVSVHSNYHTLDELIPIFESIMK